ncbi:NupC/NupG family nucleoside CNT transporter [Vibrio sp. SCSIO 43137]|uniref:NupC/NupG family nucleoside CNT transporter n=1 Tax=Vibrio sp. SCSIO 43137 TaxID=3021011 RepID=UPI0023078189|nr:NupC/NupG family nucleoside CNT transporter [Vibrio sp. SCSIO 43137]WCE30776.1 NupC/NupG family nucleoside CNT transporter [Vibrio sp. SCSIO 43137]
MDAIISIVGIIVLLFLGYLLSDNKKAIKLRTVGGVFAIQAMFGAFVLYIPVGKDILFAVSSAVNNVIAYGNSGIGFLFGNLVNFSVPGVGFIFAFSSLPIIIFFSALISTLYYLGIMGRVINFLGGGLQKVLGTSRAESLSATGNIFVGATEAPLLVRPYVMGMTKSEFFAVMCGGMASVAGGVLAGYAAMGVKMEYLVAASFMAAPGGLLFAKLIKPETEEVNDKADPMADIAPDDKPSNVFDAAAGGASAGLQLALNIGAMLIAFIGLIALINGMLSGIGGVFGFEGLTLELILGYIFSPLAFIIGVPMDEVLIAGSFIGQKVVTNEFVAYANFAPYLADAADVILSERTKAIISFALCGFANLGSIAILLGGLGCIVPQRRHEIARFGLKAVIAGTLSNLMSATLAGLFLAL